MPTLFTLDKVRGYDALLLHSICLGVKKRTSVLVVVVASIGSTPRTTATTVSVVLFVGHHLSMDASERSPSSALTFVSALLLLMCCSPTRASAQRKRVQVETQLVGSQLCRLWLLLEGSKR